MTELERIATLLRYNPRLRKWGIYMMMPRGFKDTYYQNDERQRWENYEAEVIPSPKNNQVAGGPPCSCKQCQYRKLKEHAIWGARNG